MAPRFLTARFIGQTTFDFEYQAVYRLEYKFGKKGSFEIKDIRGTKAIYGALESFEDEWDMQNIPTRYKANNPNLREELKNNA